MHRISKRLPSMREERGRRVRSALDQTSEPELSGGDGDVDADASADCVDAEAEAEGAGADMAAAAAVATEVAAVAADAACAIFLFAFCTRLSRCACGVGEAKGRAEEEADAKAVADEDEKEAFETPDATAAWYSARRKNGFTISAHRTLASVMRTNPATFLFANRAPNCMALLTSLLALANPRTEAT